MKNTEIQIITILLIMVLCISLFAVPAVAEGGESKEPVTVVEPIEVIEPTEPQPTEPQPPNSLTPDGNLTLVDDIKGEQSRDKQFITMQSKNGNLFYLVIDRDDDKENIYFLNLVDEADLMALMGDAPVTPEAPTVCDTCTEKCDTGSINTNCPVCSVDKNACNGTAPAPAEPADTTEDTGGSNAGLLIVVLIVGLIGGAYYYFKIKKPKQAKSKTNLDEYDDDDDEYDFGNTEDAQDNAAESEDDAK